MQKICIKAKSCHTAPPLASMVARITSALTARSGIVSSEGRCGVSRIPKKTGRTIMAKRNYAESRLQAEIVKALSLMGVFCLMCPNGEITDMSAKKYTRLVALGFRLGAPDLFLFSRGTNKFFGMELKKPGGKQSPGQVSFQEKCVANNWPYVVVDSLDDAVAAAKGWGLCR